MNSKFLLTCIIAASFFAGCCSEESQMKRVAYKYSMAMANYEVDEAQKYATEETQATFERAKILLQSIDPEYIVKDTPADIKIVKTERINDTLAFAIYHKTTPIKDFCDTIYLLKRDKRWYAHVPLIFTLPKTENDTAILK